MKILNSILCIAFLGFAYLNFNDPDPWVWVPIYGYAGTLCGLAAFNHFYPKAYLFGSLVYIIYAIQHFVTKDGVWDWITKHDMQDIAATMRASNPWVENTREFFGLLIITAALLLNYWVWKRRTLKSKA